MIGFDIDDTVFDTSSVVRNYFLDKLDYDVNPRLKHFVIVPGLDDKQILEHIRIILTEYVDEFKPLPGAIEGLQNIYTSTRNPICFITARYSTPDVTDATHRLLQKHLTMPYDLHQCRTSFKKHIICNLKLSYFVDDRVTVAKDSRKICKRSFLVNQPWNIKKQVPNVTRVTSLMEVDKFLIQEKAYETEGVS